MNCLFLCLYYSLHIVIPLSTFILDLFFLLLSTVHSGIGFIVKHRCNVAFEFGQNKESVFFCQKGFIMLVPGRVMERSTLCWGDSELMTSLRVMQHTDMPLFLYFWVYSSFCVARHNSGIKLCLSWPYMKRQSHFWGPLLKSQIPHLLYLKVCPHLRCFLLVSPGLHWIYWQWYPALKRFHDPSQFFGLAWWSVWLIRGSAVLSRGVLQRIEGSRLSTRSLALTLDQLRLSQSCTNEQRHAVGFEGSAWTGRRSCRSCQRQ